ncbi:HEPN domain-containing protein [Paenibacillus tarimensis]
MREDTQAWVSKARIDAESANILYDNGLLDTCCYHCQQSSEKYLKALLCELCQPIPKTHDLEKLGRLIIDAGIDFKDSVLEDCMSLTGIDTLVRPGI